MSRRPLYARPERVRGHASGRGNGYAPQRRLPQPWASRRVEQGRGDAQGEGSREAPLGWVSHWKVRLCGSPRMAGRSACVEAQLSRASAAKRRAGPRRKDCPRCMERSIWRRRAPNVGNGRLWVVRRPLREGRYATERLGRHGQRDGPGSECCVRSKGGTIPGPLGRPGGRLQPAPVLPSMSGPHRFNARRRVGSGAIAVLS